jgi:hypothetical protein
LITTGTAIYFPDSAPSPIHGLWGKFNASVFAINTTATPIEPDIPFSVIAVIGNNPTIEDILLNGWELRPPAEFQVTPSKPAKIGDNGTLVWVLTEKNTYYSPFEEFENKLGYYCVDFTLGEMATVSGGGSFRQLGVENQVIGLLAVLLVFWITMLK